MYAPFADYHYVKKSLEKPHRWAKVCLKTKKSKQALYGIVQGSRFKDLELRAPNLLVVWILMVLELEENLA